VIRMSELQYLELERVGGNATVWLNRPEQHNAFHAELIDELHQILQQLSQDSQVRVIVLAGRGRSFCAGADLQWMQAQAQAEHGANLADARALAQMLVTLAQSPKPTLARVQGAVLGGGMGLAAACDVVVAGRSARFGTTEVRLGLTPSTIAPYVIAAIGERAARRYFQTGERFDGDQALRLGLIHELVDDDQLDLRIAQMLSALHEAAPGAQTHCKRLLSYLRGRGPTDPQVIEYTARSIADVRAGAEAREGMAAFFSKRKPLWSD
jgi:methylglutaconyl-CoA hydratase